MEKRGTTNQRATSLGTRRCHGCVRTLLGRLLDPSRFRAVAFRVPRRGGESVPRHVLPRHASLYPFSSSALRVSLLSFAPSHSSLRLLFVGPTTAESAGGMIPFTPFTLSFSVYSPLHLSLAPSLPPLSLSLSSSPSTLLPLTPSPSFSRGLPSLPLRLSLSTLPLCLYLSHRALPVSCT